MTPGWRNALIGLLIGFVVTCAVWWFLRMGSEISAMRCVTTTTLNYKESAMQEKKSEWFSKGCVHHVVTSTQLPGEDQQAFCDRHTRSVQDGLMQFPAIEKP